MKYLLPVLFVFFFGCKQKPLIIKPISYSYDDTEFICNCDWKILAIIPPGTYKPNEMVMLPEMDTGGCHILTNRRGMAELKRIEHFKDTVTVTNINYDSAAKCLIKTGLAKAKGTIEIGDTVMVDIIMHGESVGIVRATKSARAYIDYLQCNCNGWYDLSDMMPYSQTWNKINK